uniref:C2H2-type domain-containing protein n=1 Tax=Caenorhabditis tropicalis TaxID=1561998 RepID=A0A1I7TPI0_9PELO
MTDGPVAKKFRIWNPAVSELSENQETDDQRNNLRTQDEESPDDQKPLDCTKNTQFQFPEVFQNYLQLAPLMLRLQQQRQMEELARRQFISTLCHVAPPQAQPLLATPTAPIPTLPKVPAATVTNPIVATALGSSLVNENCCAVCGSVFRLTGDLVQHMRNNHRKSKFKRKSDLRQ